MQNIRRKTCRDDRKPLSDLKTIQNRKVSIIPYCTITIVVVTIVVEHRAHGISKLSIISTIIVLSIFMTHLSTLPRESRFCTF